MRLLRGNRQTLAGRAVWGTCAAIALLAAGCSGGDELPDQAQSPDEFPTTTTTVAAGVPEALALNDTCPRLEAALVQLQSVTLIGDDAIVAVEALREELPSSHRPHADTILSIYTELEEGYTEVLLDPERIGETTEAGVALEAFLADSCDLKLVTS